MHMKATKAHFFKVIHLPPDLIRIQFAVPCPEGRAPVFGGGFLKKRHIQLFSFILLV